MPNLPENTAKPSRLDSRIRDLSEYHPGFQFKNPDEPGRWLRANYTSLGRIIDLQSKSLDLPVNVFTDSGAVVSKQHEIGTSHLMGCFGVFISGPNGNALIHMTPKTKLGYEIRPEFNYLQRSMDIIAPALAELGPLTDCRMVLLANMVPHHLYAEEHRRELQAVAEAFRTLGIGHVKVVGDMPLVQTTLYFSPERPDELLALGYGAAYDPQGSEVRLGGLREHWIPIGEDKPVDFGEMPTPEEVERIRQEQYKKFLESWGK